MYNLIEYSDGHSKTSGSLWQCYRDESAVDNNGNIIDFSDDNNNSASLNFKQKIIEQTGNAITKVAKILVSLKNLSNFRRAIVMPLFNCEISLQLKWSRSCIIVAGTANQNSTF